MDEKAAIARISELEDRFRKVLEERNNYASMVTNYQAFVNAIPSELPDGTEVINAYEWLRWAKKQLGYIR